jgi:Uma2 family endonuclease
MVSTTHQATDLISENDYLTSELASLVKREFVDGKVYAMAGAGYNHNCITGNLFSAINNHLKGQACTAFVSDMKLKISRDYFYPDILVDCSQFSAQDYCVTAPILIVEVLSKSTRKMDMTTKLLRYINIPSLLEYVLIEQDIVSVQVMRKHKHWLPEYYFLGDEVMLESIGLSLPVADIYERVDNMDGFR